MPNIGTSNLHASSSFVAVMSVTLLVMQKKKVIFFKGTQVPPNIAGEGAAIYGNWPGSGARAVQYFPRMQRDAQFYRTEGGGVGEVLGTVCCVRELWIIKNFN